MEEHARVTMPAPRKRRAVGAAGSARQADPGTPGMPQVLSAAQRLVLLFRDFALAGGIAH